MKDNIKQELIDWQWHNCVPEHRAYDMAKSNVFCADCMVAFVKADRLKRHLTSRLTLTPKAAAIEVKEINFKNPGYIV